MSTLQNDMIFESINESFDIRPCFNGVGNWEVFDDTGNVQKVLDTFDEATHWREQLVLEAWEDSLQRTFQIYYAISMILEKWVNYADLVSYPKIMMEHQ